MNGSVVRKCMRRSELSLGATAPVAGQIIPEQTHRLSLPDKNAIKHIASWLMLRSLG
jgi:hypothetical protein